MAQSRGWGGKWIAVWIIAIVCGGCVVGATDPSSEAGDVESSRLTLPFGLDPGDASLGAWGQAFAIILGTYVLEDATTVTTGILIRRGAVAPMVGLLAVLLGIFSGDLGLYVIGWFAGRRVLRWRWVNSALGVDRIDAMADWFDRRGWSAVVASRFIPGSRLPLYVAAGALGRKPWRFALWTFLAVLIWAPVMLLLVVLVGDAAAAPFTALFGDSWIALAFAVLLVLIVVRTLPLLLTGIGRRRLHARVSRLWRWEFWPAWIFYLPMVPVITWLSLRYRGFQTITAANPGIEHGGFVGESKYDILSELPAEWIIPTERIGSDQPATVAEIEAIVGTHGWSYPLILKPDVGERGAGLRKIADPASIADALELADGPQIVQPWDPGPLEAGVFFYRHPEEERGHVFSITWKEFPRLRGDGTSSVRELIWNHPRLRMQGRTFERRLGTQLTRVLDDGETMTLTIAGNHCQGTLFRDGGHLISDALEDSMNEIACSFDGFYFGRFDIRFAEEDDLRRGVAFRIVELNGVTSESTNIYDPMWTLLRAYATLTRQWTILFRIGAENRRRGHRPSRVASLVAALYRHYFKRQTHRLAD